TLVRPDGGSAGAGGGGAAALALTRGHAALAVRLVPLAPRADQEAVRLRLPDRGLHPRPQAELRLLRDAAPARWPPDRQGRREEPSRRGRARGAERALRAVALGRRRARGRP